MAAALVVVFRRDMGATFLFFIRFALVFGNRSKKIYKSTL